MNRYEEGDYRVEIYQSGRFSWEYKVERYSVHCGSMYWSEIHKAWTLTERGARTSCYNAIRKDKKRQAKIAKRNEQNRRTRKVIRVPSS